MQLNAWIIAQGWMQLVGAHLDRDHFVGAVFEDVIGKAAGGAAHIEHYFAGKIKLERPRNRCQFERSAADVLFGGAQLYFVIVADQKAGLLLGLPVYKYRAQPDPALGLAARRGQPARYRFLIQPLLAHDNPVIP
jgi:hypothetical protein